MEPTKVFKTLSPANLSHTRWVDTRTSKYQEEFKFQHHSGNLEYKNVTIRQAKHQVPCPAGCIIPLFRICRFGSMINHSDTGKETVHSKQQKQQQQQQQQFSIIQSTNVAK